MARLFLVSMAWFGLAHTGSSSDISVVSYNNYWWNVRQNSRWSSLYSRISSNRADLYGFQECENVQQVLQGSGLVGYQSFQGPNKPAGNPAPLAWNGQIFAKIGDPGSVWVANDKYGNRYLNWVRLRHHASGASVFFANTHGPLNNCGDSLGIKWADGITSNRKSGDVIVLTGDFNCAVGTAAMRRVLAVVDRGIKHGIDHILTSAATVSGSARPGSPSDHPLIGGTISLSSGSPSPSPSPSGTCQSVWNNNAGGHTCGARIQWLESNRGMSDRQAKNQVAGEFPSQCGACAVGGGSPSPSPSCNDKHEHCGWWSQNGYCGGSWQASMQYYCPRSCGYCTNAVGFMVAANSTLSQTDTSESQGQMTLPAAPNSTSLWEGLDPIAIFGLATSSCFERIAALWLPVTLIPALCRLA